MPICICTSLMYALMSLMVAPFGICIVCITPAFLPFILTLSAASSALRITSLVLMPVTIASIRMPHSSSLSSKLTYTTFLPAKLQLSAMFCINKLLPDPLPPAKMFSSPGLNPPYSMLSIVFQPVLFCPRLSLMLCIRPAGSSQ